MKFSCNPALQFTRSNSPTLRDLCPKKTFINPLSLLFIVVGIYNFAQIFMLLHSSCLQLYMLINDFFYRGLLLSSIHNQHQALSMATVSLELYVSKRKMVKIMYVFFLFIHIWLEYFFLGTIGILTFFFSNNI